MELLEDILARVLVVLSIMVAVVFVTVVFVCTMKLVGTLL